MTSIGFQPQLPSFRARPASPAAQTGPSGLARRAAERLGEVVGGAVGALYHVPVGMATGIGAAVSPGPTNGESRAYDFASIGEATVLGAAGGGLCGGPAGSALGAVLGLGTGLVGRAIAGGAGADTRFVLAVEGAVREAIADNRGGPPIKIMVQNVTEGAVVGGARGLREGWTVGADAGIGAVGAFVDIGEGIARAVLDVIHAD